jgi:hypothetical protein
VLDALTALVNVYDASFYNNLKAAEGYKRQKSIVFNNSANNILVKW